MTEPLSIALFLIALAAVLATGVFYQRARSLKRAYDDMQTRLISLEEQSGQCQQMLQQSKEQQARLEVQSEHLTKQLEQAQSRLVQTEMQLTENRQQQSQLAAEKAELQERLQQQAKAAGEKIALLQQAEENLQTVFKSLSADALSKNNESFLKLAEESLSRFQHRAKDDLETRQKAIAELTTPIRERLERFDEKINSLEKARVGAYAEIHQQINELVQNHLPRLHSETEGLVKALRQPQARGRWGELQLKRVVEMAGMLEHCDFKEQVSQSSETGRLRPDLIVYLPGGRQVVVDAKAPVDAYLTAVEAEDDQSRRAALQHHARQVRNHVSQLAKKSYFDQFDPTPEFVVLFVPGEAFFSAALSEDPGLIEFGAENRVIPASPTTLIALLKAVSYGWRQEAMAENAREVAELGKTLYQRISTLGNHWAKVGERLNQTVDVYNKSVGALETRVLPSARKFRDLKTVSDKREIEPQQPVTQEPRTITAPELLAGNAESPSGEQSH